MRRWSVGLLLALGFYHLLLTVSLVANYGLRHPFLDQFRLYERYLSSDLWSGVMALENGHRPVLPGLVRWMDLFWLDGHGLLLTLSAWAAAALVLVLLLRPIWRELGAPLAAAASCALVVSLLWGAHARMFIHAFEAQHLWYILLGVVAGAAAAMGAGSPARRWGLALLCCVAATFSFGPGLASFASLFVLVVLQRAGWRVAGAVVLVALASAAIYLWWLPGADAVRGQSQGLDLPWAIHYVGARWGAWWIEFLPADGPLDMVQRRWLAFGLGTLAVGLLGLSAARRWWRRDVFSATEQHGLVLVAFAVTANTLIAANRVGYFHQHPGQLFAERYLFWTAVLWAGVALYGLARVSAKGSTRAAAVALVATAVVAVLAIGPALQWRGWSAEVYRRVEVSALAERMDIRSAEVFRDITDGPLDNAWRCTQAMREHAVGVFAPGSMPAALDLVPDAGLPQMPAAWRQVDAPGGPFWSVQALLPAEWSALAADRHWLVDASGRVVGVASFTFHSAPATKPLRLVRPLMDGLQGFVRGQQPGAVWLVREHQGQYRAVVRFAADAPASQGQGSKP